jgi:1D-myo-inositol 3-kinase
MAVDFLVVGHVARDLIPGGHRVGGAAYAALAAARLGRRTALVTSAAPDFATASALLDVEVHVIPSPVSTTFENRYPSGRRTQVLHSRAERLAPLPAVSLDVGAVILLAPIAGELHPADWLPLGRDVAVSLQGLLRRWDEQGRVRASTRALPALHGALAVFFSDEDVPSTAARSRLVARCCEEARFVLLTRGPGGATLYQRGRAEADVPAFRASEADPTGAGDVFAAAFLVRFQETGDPFEAALFAAAAGSLTVEQLGLDGVPTREQIQDRLNGHAAATRAGRAYG